MPRYPAASKVKIVLVVVQRRLSGGWAAAHHLSYRFVTGMRPADVRTFNRGQHRPRGAPMTHSNEGDLVMRNVSRDRHIRVGLAAAAAGLALALAACGGTGSRNPSSTSGTGSAAS